MSTQQPKCDNGCRALCIIGIVIITLTGLAHIYKDLVSPSMMIPKWINITAVVAAIITLMCTYQWATMKINRT